MKKSSSLPLLVGACALGAASSAQAATLIYEPFNYTAGQAITGQANTTSAAPETWFSSGTVGATLHQIGTPGLTAPAGFPTEAGNMADVKNGAQTYLNRLNIPNAFSGTTPVYAGGSTLFYSLLLNVPSTSGMSGSITGTTGASHGNPNANNDFLIGFNNVQGSQAVRSSSWNGELAIRLGSVANTYNLGVRGSNTTPGTTYWTADLTPGTTHLVVVEAQINAGATDGTNSIWMDPNLATFGAATPPTADGSSNGIGSTNGTWNMESILMGAGIAANLTPTDTYMDEIRVGDTWADVTSVTPEPTTIGLLGCGALVLATRRRRKA
jgi:hypothetical protein